MNINALLKGVNCDCSKHHTCNIKKVYIEQGAISHLQEICEKYNKILIVADENTFGAAGQKVIDVLGEKIADKVIFSGKTVLIPDEKAIDAVNSHLEGIDYILAVGSGVIQDLCKCVSFFSHIPYADVATAPSMDGYASDGAAMILKGMKETVKAGLPEAIIADTDVLKDAPIEMIKAGYGDIIGKYSALCDWELSYLVNGEYFCKYIYDTTYEMIEKTLKVADSLLKRDAESIRILMEALVVVGIMMSFAGSSRPASGSEHHLSHFFEITGIVNGEDYFCHGIDVAYSTVITTKIRENILNRQFAKESFCLSEEDYKAVMNRVYKSVSAECMSLQEKVGNYKKDRSGIYNAKEKEIRALFEKMPSSQEILKMLEKAELDINEFYNLYGKDKIRDAVLYAKDLKDRYTVLWMNYDMFGTDTANY